MNINTLDGNQKLGIIIALTLMFYIVIYLLFIAPILDKNTQLQAQIDKATQLTHYLGGAQKEMANLPQFKSLSNNQTQNIIKSAFAKNRINLRKKSNKEHLITYSFNKVAFDPFLNAIKQLKSKHGITISNANIRRTSSGEASGIVDFFVY